MKKDRIKLSKTFARTDPAWKKYKSSLKIENQHLKIKIKSTEMIDKW